VYLGDAVGQPYLHARILFVEKVSAMLHLLQHIYFTFSAPNYICYIYYLKVTTYSTFNVKQITVFSQSRRL
jgi:hypothetical protein